MLFDLSGFHLCLLSVIGSWLSWNKHFRWAIKFKHIKSLWILFKCQNLKSLALNITIYILFFNSAHTGKNEVKQCTVSRYHL